MAGEYFVAVSAIVNDILAAAAMALWMLLAEVQRLWLRRRWELLQGAGVAQCAALTAPMQTRAILDSEAASSR